MSARQKLLRLALVGLAACGAAAAEPAAPGPVGIAGEGARAPSARDVETTRQQVFAELARVDRRFARRIGRKPAGTELLFPENRAPSELAALFEFDARAAALREQSARAPHDRVLVRLLGEELARVDAERDLPRSASAIVRTLALDLPIAESHEDDVRSEDHALEATLDRLRGSLRDGSLGPLQLAELDDALDPFEKRTTRLPMTPGAIARLRVALTSMTSAPAESLLPWDKTRSRLEAFVGPFSSPVELVRALEVAHGALAGRLDAVLPKDRMERERLGSRGASLLLSSGTECPEVDLPDVQAPIERRGYCALLTALSKGDPASLVAADLALDMARWALAVHHTRVDVAAAFAARSTRTPIDEVDGAHAFRFSLVHPIEAISLGWVAALVARDPGKLASSWLAKGLMRPDEARAVLGPALM